MLTSIIQKCCTYYSVDIKPEDRFCESCRILIKNKTMPIVKIQVELSNSDTDEIEFTSGDSFIESAKSAKLLVQKQKQSTNPRNIKCEVRDQKEKQGMKDRAKTTVLSRSKFSMHSDSVMKRNIFF